MTHPAHAVAATPSPETVPARCPRHGLQLSGGPVVYHCPAGPRGHQVTAADIEDAAEAVRASGKASGHEGAGSAASTTVRTLHAICEITRLCRCDQCPARPHGPCVTSDGGTDAYHVARFARARRAGLLSEADVTVVVDAAGPVFTAATLVHDDTLGSAR